MADNLTKEQRHKNMPHIRSRERDDEVNKKLLFLGWTVIRFWGKDIMKNVDECIKVIDEAVFDIITDFSTLDDYRIISERRI